MGVTIHWRLAQTKKYVKNTLDVAEAVAKEIMEKQAAPMGIEFSIERKSDLQLYINIGGCETLAFDFNDLEKYKSVEGWNYQKSTIIEDGLAEILDDTDVLWTSDFCKTQFADNLVEHKWVADILKVVSSKCRLAIVGDEGDYYHSGNLNDATEAIAENGKLIDSIGGMLGGLGYKQDQIIKGGETKIGKKKHGN